MAAELHWMRYSAPIPRIYIRAIERLRTMRVRVVHAGTIQASVKVTLADAWLEPSPRWYKFLLMRPRSLVPGKLELTSYTPSTLVIWRS
jgi:hypothetical protein